MKLVISIILVVLLITILILSFVYGSSTASINEICIENVTINNNTLHVSGQFISSSSVYKSYSYQIQDDCLFLTIKKCLPTSIYKNGNFSIEIQDDLVSIESVFLVGHDDKMLIWTKNSMEK